MARSDANTVEDYLAELPPERRETVSTVRAVILHHLPTGYEEVMDFGMISYVIPLATYPTTYNKHPLMYAALASQKNYCSVYLMNISPTSSNAFTVFLMNIAPLEEAAWASIFVIKLFVLILGKSTFNLTWEKAPVLKSKYLKRHWESQHNGKHGKNNFSCR